MPPKKDNYESMKVAELRTLLKARGLNQYGVKKVLIKRLEENDNEVEEVEEENPEEEVEEVEEVEEENPEEEVEEVEEENPEEEVEEEHPEKIKKSSKKLEIEVSDEEKPPKKLKLSVKENFPRIKRKDVPPKSKKSYKIQKDSRIGIFGNKNNVSEILNFYNDSLEILEPGTKDKKIFDGLVENIFSSKTLKESSSHLRAYIKPKHFEACWSKLSEKLRKVYLDLIEEISNEIINALQKKAIPEFPRFDAEFGVYRIKNYVFYLDPETQKNLVYAHIKENKILPLTKEIVESAPKDYEFYHIHNSTEIPSSKEVSRISSNVIFPSLESEGNAEGKTFVSKPFAEVENQVEKELASITIPKPSEETFRKYKKSQIKLKSTNYKNIALDANISLDDARYIAIHYAELSKIYER